MEPRGSSGQHRPALSKKSVDLARNLLSALFMGIRTAKIHDPSNEAFENAVQSVFRAAEALFAATGGFSLKFVEDTVFLNDGRLTFESSAFQTMRTLRSLMEEEGLGGLELSRPPSVTTIRKLISMFAPSARPDPAVQAELAREIKMLGVQRLVDQSQDIKVDRRVFAVQCYGKLILAVREQLDRIEQARAADWAQRGPPRLRLVRVVQDLVELVNDRADFLMRLSTNQHGAAPAELHGANTCLLTIVLGRAIDIPRAELVDVAVAALFHHIGAKVDAEGRFVWQPEAAHASLARLLAESGVGHSSYLRALVVGELPLVVPADAPVRAHPYARLVKVAATFDRLVTGFGESDPPLHPLAALARMHNWGDPHLDVDFVDLLINVLRVYPVGARVQLHSGEMALVTNQIGGARWDRPVVEVQSQPPRVMDLSLRDGGRFVGRIVSTARFVGDKSPCPMDETAVPSVEAPTDLSALLEGEDIIPDELPGDYDVPTYPEQAGLTEEMPPPLESAPPVLPEAPAILPSVPALGPRDVPPLAAPVEPTRTPSGRYIPVEPAPLDGLAEDQWGALTGDGLAAPMSFDDGLMERLDELPGTHSDTLDEEDETTSGPTR